MATILLYLFILITFVQILYWIVLFRRLATYQPPILTKKIQEPVSVIICAHNEASNLKKNLPLILNQVYSNYEVVVVNDRSTDDSKIILSQFEKKYPHLRVLHLEDFERTIKSKKYALTKGIDFSQHELLLLTDADCRPASNQWVQEMQSYIDGDIQIGLGYGPYEVENGLLNGFARYETTLTALQYLSYALWGMPYMGVGRNLIYRKELFYKVNGFKSHEHVLSGDDDLLINQIAKFNNISIIINPNTYIFSKSKEDWQGFYIQKSRHLSTSTHYKWIHILLLGGYSMSQFIFYSIFFVTLFIGNNWSIVIFMLLFRFFIVLWISHPIYKKLSVSDIWKHIPMLDFMYWLYLMSMTPSMIFSKHEQWK